MNTNSISSHSARIFSIAFSRENSLVAAAPISSSLWERKGDRGGGEEGREERGRGGEAEYKWTWYRSSEDALLQVFLQTIVEDCAERRVWSGLQVKANDLTHLSKRKGT